MIRTLLASRFAAACAALAATSGLAHAHEGSDHGSHHALEMTAWAALTGVVFLLGYAVVSKRRGNQ